MNASKHHELAVMWEELADSSVDSVTAGRAAVLLLRIRIEAVADSVPAESLADTRTTKRPQRLWALAALAPHDWRSEALTLARRAGHVYAASSDYLHGRRASSTPSRAELADWLDTVLRLEGLGEVVSRPCAQQDLPS